MDRMQQTVVQAVSFINELEIMHQEFVGQFEFPMEPESHLGVLSVDADLITCLSLGHEVIAAHRPIVVKGQVSALEYHFVTRWKKEEVPILCFFLQPNGFITHDPEGSEKFQEFNDRYIRDHILEAVAASLLSSCVFSPSAQINH